MNNIDKSVASNGKKIYNELEQMLKANHSGQYVAIEPTSAKYFVDKSLGLAIARGKAIYPNRPLYATAIGTEIHVPVR